MLFIIYGATLEWGWRSREYFRRQGFQVITKNNYVDEDSPIDGKNYREAEGSYARWREARIAAGASSNQLKPLRVIDRPEKLDFFLAAASKEQKQ